MQTYKMSGTSCIDINTAINVLEELLNSVDNAEIMETIKKYKNGQLCEANYKLEV